jgi:hypothetical protein
MGGSARLLRLDAGDGAGVSFHDYGPDRGRAVRFVARLNTDGRSVVIDDDDFHYDAMLKLDGDWPSDAERMAYAEAVAAALNAAVIPCGKPTEAPK